MNNRQSYEPPIESRTAVFTGRLNARDTRRKPRQSLANQNQMSLMQQGEEDKLLVIAMRLQHIKQYHDTRDEL